MNIDTNKKEVEKKYRVIDISNNELKQKLNEIGAEFVSKKREVDTYFHVAGRDSLANKECLRVRVTENSAEITYKPPTEIGDNNKYFAKQESNLSVPDGKEAIELLLTLGNRLIVTVDKSRDYYKLGDCVISIDNIADVGTFVEIEVQTNDVESGLCKLDEIRDKLGLDESAIDILPYRDIMLAEQHKQNGG